MLNRAQYLRRLLKFGFPRIRPTSPPFLNFNVTSNCNMSCRHCDNDTWHDPSSDLTYEEIKKFSHGYGPVEIVALGGGEPFLRKDLVEVVELFVNINGARNLNITTNGFETESICSMVRQILDKCPGSKLDIALSLDGFQPTHDDIRRPEAFSKAMGTARRLKAMSEDNKRLNICFNATVHNSNFRELPALARFLREEFQANLNFSVLVGTPRDTTLELPSESDLKQTIDGINATREISSITSDFLKVYNEVLLKTKNEERQVIPCRACSLISVIYANGEVLGCTEHPALGNIRDASFQEIWHGLKARKLYKSICSGACNCTNICYLMPSLTSYWKFPFLLLHQRLKRNL